MIIKMSKAMTEPERIVAEGTIPPDFLKEEILCEFHVTEQRKKIWAVELDLLLQLDRVCQKHHLRYFLISGTLLGAIRHRGFIPWDDDADIAMPRADYEKFIRLKDEFREPIFLQTPYTDNNYAASYARLRNSNTSAISPIIKYQKMNQGLFIDIFPLDNFVAAGALERYEQINRLNIENGTFMRLTNPELNEKNRQRVAAYHRDHIKDFEEIQRLATMYNDRKTDKLAIMLFTAEPLEINTWDAADFVSSIAGEFAGYSFPIPVGYRNILTQTYGDYMTFPPVEERGQHHGQYILEPDIPYKEFLGW